MDAQQRYHLRCFLPDALFTHDPTVLPLPCLPKCATQVLALRGQVQCAPSPSPLPTACSSRPASQHLAAPSFLPSSFLLQAIALEGTSRFSVPPPPYPLDARAVHELLHTGDPLGQAAQVRRTLP